MQTALTKNEEMTGAGAENAFSPVARAVDFLVENFDAAPSLDDAAHFVGLSPAHFQRVFKAGAGVSPKRFLQYLAAREAKKAMAVGETVLDASLAAGLSGPSRLHDLFLVAEAMTPGQYRKKGAGLTIRYGVAAGPLGRVLMGATAQGVCWLSFIGSDEISVQIAEMRGDWPNAEFVRDDAAIEPLAAKAFAFALDRPVDEPIRLHVQGTNFQLKVWQALLSIPHGALVTYGDIASSIGAPKAARAVGAAVGSNMISVLIPCHRVILASGVIHNYRWGPARKKAILAMEQASSSAA